MSAPGFSLERRLMRRLSLILAGSFLLFTVVYLFFIHNDSVFHASEAVGEMARDLAPLIVRRHDGSFAFAADRAAAVASWPAGSSYAAVDIASNRVVAGSDTRLLGELLNHSADEVLSARVIARQAEVDVLSVDRVEASGRTYRIAVLRPMTMASIARIGITHEFAEEILPCFAPSLLLAAIVTWVTIRRNLKPLRRASMEASAVAADNPGQRMSTGNLSSEIKPVIDAVNRALSRLESALSAQRRFTANAAHELRTPLAVLRGRVDGLEQGSTRKALTRDIDRMSRAVSQMLLTARLQARAAGEMGAVDLAGLARDLVAELAPFAQGLGRDIALETVARPVVQASEAGLQSAVRNLIENALRYTPHGGSVTVRVGPRACIVVEDDGPGVADDDKQRIFEPFWRGQGDSVAVAGRAGESGGAGLGLAIVREVAALHGGSISVEDSYSGGARFILALPDLAEKRLNDPVRPFGAAPPDRLGACSGVVVTSVA